MSQGFFESDENYHARVTREADEQTIKEVSGSAPSQGFFEPDTAYKDRISTEANERRVEASSGSPPSQGFFESDTTYRSRVAKEANEHEIERATGSSPSQGWFETEKSYETRVRKEANEQTIARTTGQPARQGWFEGDHAYRSRIATEARELRIGGGNDRAATSDPQTSSDHRARDGSTSKARRSSSESVARHTRRGPKWFLLFLALGAVYHGGKYLYDGTSRSTSSTSTSTSTHDPGFPATPARTVAPSFDCAKATWKSERIVCSSQQLSVLDVALSNAYRNAAARSPDRAAELRISENHWLRKTRESCADIPCLQQVYEERLRYLSKF